MCLIIQSQHVLLMDDVEGASYSFRASVVFWMMLKEQVIHSELVLLLDDVEGASHSFRASVVIG